MVAFSSAMVVPVPAPAADTVLRLRPVQASGPSTVGFDMSQENGQFSSNYRTWVSGGGTGFLISGNKVRFDRSSSQMHVNGKGSNGIVIKGNDAAVMLADRGEVDEGATGIRVTGKQAALRLLRPLDAQGAGSTGVLLEGGSARLSGVGIGNTSLSAIGIHVTGNQASLELKDSPPLSLGAQPIASTIGGGATGLRIDGSQTSIRLRDTERVLGEGSQGVVMGGIGNALHRDGGSSEVTEGGTGLFVQGRLSRVTLSGGTILASGQGAVGMSFRNPDGPRVVFTSGAGHRQAEAGRNQLVAGADSRIIVSNGATGIHIAGAYPVYADLEGKILVQAHGLALKLGDEGAFVAGQARNGVAGSIVAQGMGASGMAAEGAAIISLDHNVHLSPPPPLPALINLGRIDVDPASGGVLPSRAALPASELEFGMSVSRGEGRNTVAVNEGTITVANSGVAMIASSSGAMAVNQGVINLQATPGTLGDGLPLFGMVALNGATAVNRRLGIINVNAANARAFHADSSSTLINQGTVNLNGNPMPARDARMGWSAGPSGMLSGKVNQVLYSSPSNLAGKRLIVGGADLDALYQVNASTLFNGVLQVDPDGVFVNEGGVASMQLLISGRVQNAAGARMALTRNSKLLARGLLVNEGTLVVRYPLGINGWMRNQPSGRLHLLGSGMAFNKQDGGIVNQGEVLAEAANAGGHRVAAFVAGPGHGNGIHNTGTLTVREGYGVMMTAGAAKQGRSMFINSGTIDFTADKGTTTALYVKNHAGHDLVNDPEASITVRGNNAIAMRSDSDSQLVNRGTIQLGEKGTTDTGMTAMVLGGRNAAGRIVNDSQGVIRIHARQSHAFLMAGSGSTLINRGQVQLLCGDSSCGVFRDTATRVGDISGSAAAAAYQFVPYFQKSAAGHELRVARSALAGYVIGTRPDGGAGTLSGGHLDASGVTVDTGFVAGTTARQARFAKVLRGEHIDGIGQIRSRSAAWQAQAWRDADGDVGVTLTKNDYRELAPDAALRPLAAALEQDYDGSELFRSLELGSVAEIGHALRQLSGAGIRSALKPLQTLEQRFVRLGHDMAETRAGFGLQLVGSRHGRPEARLGGSAYDLVVLRQRFAPGSAGQLTARYGFASIRPGATAADAGLDGHSQLFGLDYAQPLGRGPTLEGEFRYAQHRFDTRRTLRYGSVDLRPQAGQRRDRFSGQLALALAPQRLGGLTLAPLLGLTVRHQRDAALTERNAGIYGLRLSAARASAVEGVFGLRVRHEAVDARHGRGWRVDAELLGRPVLYRQAAIRQARFASLPGGGRFTLAADRARFGYDGRLSLGFQGKDSRLDLGAHISRDAASGDHGVTARYQRVF